MIPSNNEPPRPEHENPFKQAQVAADWKPRDGTPPLKLTETNDIDLIPRESVIIKELLNYMRQLRDQEKPHQAGKDVETLGNIFSYRILEKLHATWVKVTSDMLPKELFDTIKEIETECKNSYEKIKGYVGVLDDLKDHNYQFTMKEFEQSWKELFGDHKNKELERKLKEFRIDDKKSLDEKVSLLEHEIEELKNNDHYIGKVVLGKWTSIGLENSVIFEFNQADGKLRMDTTHLGEMFFRDGVGFRVVGNRIEMEREESRKNSIFLTVKEGQLQVTNLVGRDFVCRRFAEEDQEHDLR